MDPDPSIIKEAQKHVDPVDPAPDSDPDPVVCVSVCHRLNMELNLQSQSLFGLLCTAVLIGRDPATFPHPPHLGSCTRGLLVSQDFDISL